jgi:hypothetical protein
MLKTLPHLRSITLFKIFLTTCLIISLGGMEKLLGQCVGPIVPSFIATCPNTTIKITAEGGTGNGYTWYDGSGNNASILATGKTATFLLGSANNTHIWVSKDGCNVRSQISIRLNPNNRFKWSGLAGNSVWATGSNWACGGPPTDLAHNIHIPPVTNNIYPNLVSTNVNYGSLYVEGGASLTIGSTVTVDDITVGPGATLTVLDGASITVRATNDAQVNSETGFIVNEGGTVNVGNATLTVNRRSYVAGNINFTNPNSVVNFNDVFVLTGTWTETTPTTANFSGAVTLPNNFTTGSQLNFVSSAVLDLTGKTFNTSGAGSFNFAVAATYSGASNSSFIKGRVAKSITAFSPSFTFPTGKGAIYRPVTVTPVAGGATATYVVEYFTENKQVSADIYDDPADDTDFIHHVSSLESWEFIRSTGDLPVTAAFNWDANSGISSANDINDLSFARYSYTETGIVRWKKIDATFSGGPTSGIVTTATLDDFGLFTLGAVNESVSLPVTFTKFAVTKVDVGIQLDWATSKEINNQGFEIQRSADGFKTFDSVAFVKGFGNTWEVQAYSFTDTKAATGPLFYRLKQIDFNGKFDFSEIKYLNGGESLTVANGTIFPNPTRGNVTVVLDGLELDKVTSFTIVGPDGRVRGKRDNVYINQLDSTLSELLASLNNGSFTILLKTRHSLIHIKVVKI